MADTSKLVPQPAVSVIVARTHVEAGLSETLASVRAQTFAEYEIVLSDPHERLALSRNQSIARSVGQCLSFIDAGQIWHSEKLAMQWARLTVNPELNWCYCGAGVPLPTGDILRPLLLGNFIPSGSVMLRRGVLEALGGFDETEGCRSCEEWEMWLRIAAHYPAGVVAETLVQEAPDGDAAGPLPLNMKHVVETAVSRHENLRDLRSQALAEICMSAGNAHLLAGRREEARLNFAEALTHTPLRSDAYLSWASSYFSSEVQRQIRDLHNLGRHLEADAKKEEVPLKRRP